MKNKKVFVLFCVIFFFAFSIYLYSGDSWVKIYGTKESDMATSIFQTLDGGYIIGGQTKAFDRKRDFVLIKTDRKGNIEWSKYYPAKGEERDPFVVETTEGNYLAAMSSFSWAPRGIKLSKIWVVKTNKKGKILWQKVYWGKYGELFKQVRKTSDGGVIIVGQTGENLRTAFDIFLLKLDKNGNVKWQYGYGRKGMEIAESIKVTSDGGYIITGHASKEGYTMEDLFLLKVNSKGKVEWYKLYGGRSEEHGSDVVEADDGGFVAGGWTRTFASRERGLEPWFIKVDKKGNIVWQKRHGNFYGGHIFSLVKIDEGYLGLGNTEGEGIRGKEMGDVITVKIDKRGNLLKHEIIGAGYEDFIGFSSKTKDGGIIACGRSFSFRKGYKRDFFVIKFDSGENVSCPFPLTVKGKKYISYNSKAKILNVYSKRFKINFKVTNTNSKAKVLNFTQKNVCY